MENGWIKLHRKLLASKVFQNNNALKIWIWCLLKATHNKRTYLMGLNQIEISEGSFIFGSFVAKEETKMAISTIWRWLKFLENEKQIIVKSSNKYSIITIIHWKDYQNLDVVGKQKVNKKKEPVVDDRPYTLKEEIKKLEENPRRDLNIVALYLEHRKPDLQNRAQFNEALVRHLKPAGKLKSFTNDQILKALDYAKKEYKDIYTLETLLKILVK